MRPADLDLCPQAVPPRAPGLWLKGELHSQPLVMAIVNRTTDSFYHRARQLDDAQGLAAVAEAAAAGADIVDIGGVRAGRGREISPDEEIQRVVPFIARVRKEFPDLVLSVDTWRSQVAQAAVDAGADLLNDTWAGSDPDVVAVAAKNDVAIVCSHTGGLPPRTDPFRAFYPEGVVANVRASLQASAERAVAAGVRPEAVLIDPTHDFGKTTWHSLELVRHTGQLVSLGYPVLMALSRKDFIGETLDLDVDERLEGTLAATAIAAWNGATVFRAHDVEATKRTLEMVAAVRGERPPKSAVRGMA